MPVINLLAIISYLSWVLGELSVGKPFKFGRLFFIISILFAMKVNNPILPRQRFQKKWQD
ncbi:hypothetical protein HYN59_15235 [Flavobacterium album]|uniref:Uncharacterized protein n=1 Tax=Flavobacterium album TaxID=2175091 RepID=A0A2S1R129_9FLAO|nr:hypothetical protein HYN59_15235 [Flavobacterium album]